jgi:adenylate cyclase
MTAKILVVDDEPDLELLVKQKFRRQIREQQYEFYFGQNGQKALEIIAEQPDLDMVLSDINMPIIDGLTLLTKTAEINPILKTVIISAYGDMGNIRMAMNRGAFDFLTKPVNFDDLEITIQKTLAHVRQLRSTLNAIKENNILKMYVDENVLNFMNRQAFESAIIANETIEATVVFMDICGFTAISETQKPDIVVALINTYFDLMVKEIIAQEGIIDKFMGDCVMAIFKGQYHLDRAIEASLAVRSQIEKIQNHIENQSNFMPKVSIGIKSGDMISGNIGSVTLRRLDYTVIGDTVNTAQRLQSVAKAGQIVVDETDFHKIKESFSCNKIDSISLKNKTNSVVTYEVIS